MTSEASNKLYAPFFWIVIVANGKNALWMEPQNDKYYFHETFQIFN